MAVDHVLATAPGPVPMLHPCWLLFSAFVPPAVVFARAAAGPWIHGRQTHREL